jgi:hypothetical protein
MYRVARTLLEQRGMLSPLEKHANGTTWIFWAEEPEPTPSNIRFFVICLKLTPHGVRSLDYGN